MPELTTEQTQELLRLATEVCKWTGHIKADLAFMAQQDLANLKDYITKITGKEPIEYT